MSTTTEEQRRNIALEMAIKATQGRFTTPSTLTNMADHIFKYLSTGKREGDCEEDQGFDMSEAAVKRLNDMTEFHNRFGSKISNDVLLDYLQYIGIAIVVTSNNPETNKMTTARIVKIPGK